MRRDPNGRQRGSRVGTIRFLLALAVVCAHVGKLPFTVPVGSLLAVQSFYIISGFLIALVWDRTYSRLPNGLSLFYANRAARIYLTYWAVLAISVAIAIGVRLLIRDWPSYITIRPPPGLRLYSLFTNLWIFGSSQAYWLGWADGSLYYTMDFTSSPYPVWRTLTLGPAWTLDLELTFYLLAPFLLARRLRTLVAIIALSFGARLSWYAMGHNVDPWNYRFFPFEIGLFVLGIAAYRISEWLAWRPAAPLLYLIFAFAVASIVGFERLGYSRSSYLYLFVFAASLPYVFALTQAWTVDGFLADMSFPLYLAHWPVMLLIRDYLPVPWPQYPGIVSAVASILVAAGLVILVERPIERWRHRRTASLANTPPPGNSAGLPQGAIAPAS
jgi:peptidoglycan/LPS O-acetylase OafA/YrhL